MSHAVTPSSGAFRRARRRLRPTWLAGAAFCAALPVTAASAADECGAAVDGVVTCTASGNPYADGVTYSPAGPLSLVTEADTVISGPVRVAGGSGTLSVTHDGEITSSALGQNALTANSNQDAVIRGGGNITNTAEFGIGARAIAGQTGGDATIALGSTQAGGAVTGGNVTTAGTNGFGLHASAVIGGANASANIVSTSGATAIGIFVEARENATAGFTSVSTQGTGAHGVYATSVLGDVSVRGGSVSTAGDTSIGVIAAGTTGAVDVALTGPLTTAGTFSPGVLATSGEGDVRVQVTDVTTAGTSSYGILARGVNASITSTGTLTTTGIGGQAATAAQAEAGSGLASIQINNSSTAGDNARAALASSVSSDASIAATGTVQTAGIGARALDAQAFGGRASISYAGPVTTTGDFAPGAMAAGGMGVTITGTGTVTTSGANSSAIVADSIYEPANVTAGTVRTSGEGSYGIRVSASQSSANVAATDVATTGRASDAVLVLAPAGADVNVGTVNASGDFSRGVVVQADNGPVTITSGTVSASGAGSGGIVGLAGGPVTVTSGSTSSTQARAIYLQSNTSTASLTVNGAARAVDSDAVSVNATTDATLTVAQGGSIASGTNAAVISGATTSVTNAGTLTGGTGGAIAAFGGAASIQNSGTINGRLMTSDGDDRVTNSGTFNVVDGSDFGGGNDVFVNSGLVNAAPAGTAATRVTLANLESFQNSGTISLANGRVGDQLVLPGSYSGSGDATLRFDVNFAGSGNTADQLVIGGAATGTTRLQMVATGDAQLIAPGGPVIVDAGAGSAPNAFVLAPENAQAGFAQYRVAFDATTGNFSLASSPSSSAQRPLRAVEGARNIWYKVTDTWSAHTRDLRDVGATGAAGGSRLWGQAYGAVVNRKDSQSILVAGTATGDTLSYRQDYFGGQLGYDFARPSGPGGFTFGATGGYVSSDMNFVTSSARGEYDSANAGLYAGARFGGAFLNVLGLYEHHWLKLRDQQPAYTRKLDGDSYGVTGELGFRIGGDSFYAEPVATLAYVHTDLDGFQAYSSTFKFDAADGLRGKLGLRLGYDIAKANGTHIILYAGGNAVKEFRGRDHLDFTNNAMTYRYGGGRIGTYGEGMSGIRIVSPNGVSGFIETVGVYGGDRSGLRGGGGRAGINIPL